MKLLAVVLESVSCCAVIGGILAEILTGGEAGYAIISVGCLGIVAGGILYGRIFIKNHNTTLSATK